MFAKTPWPADAVKFPVLTACQSVPPVLSTNDKVPDPFVVNTWSAEPSDVGSVIAVVPNPIASIYATPSTYKSLNSKDDVPKSTSLSVIGANIPSAILTWLALEA